MISFKKYCGKVKNGFGRLFSWLGKFQIVHWQIAQVYFLAFATAFVMECLSKRSPLKALVWTFTDMPVFLVNIMIVAVLYGIALCFRHKYFGFALAAFVWLFLGVADCIVISCRHTPLTAGDIRTIFSVIQVFPKYISPFGFVLIGAGIIAAVLLLILAYRKLPVIKGKFSRLKGFLGTAAVAAAGVIMTVVAVHIEIMTHDFSNLRKTYQEYGLAFCFVQSVMDSKISKPNDYSKEKIDEILDEIATGGTAGEGKNPEVAVSPNVIFVQLESFFNVNRLEGVQFTENPIPTMTALYEKYSTGLLHVPSISAGTANTEFEVLTGMNMEDFGLGEYPFSTILNGEKTAESIAYNLKECGYATHGIHNNIASFYNRKKVYPNLGIDTFTPIEYMVGTEKNQLGWAKDSILTKYIGEALDSTDGADFVFTVSVQGHGNYPDEDILNDESLLVSLDGIDGDVGEFNFAYYLEQIKEMDAFVKELINYLENREEETVLVLYGDHLPGFDFTEEDLSTGTLYDTEYVIWSNFDMGERQVKDMEAFELNSYVLEMLGCDNGLINKVHQGREDFSEEKYLGILQALEYDMLYGDMNCWNGVCPYRANVLKYGYDEISITDIKTAADPDSPESFYLFVEGNYFTEYSTVFINGVPADETVYWDEHWLLVPRAKIKSGDSIVVSQSKDSLTELSASAPYYCTNEKFDRAG